MSNIIRLFEKDAVTFDTLGIGVLKDASSCVVTEELNGLFELEMDYPVSGSHYKDLIEGRLIYTKPNDVLDEQPFRIYKITKPIDGTVTVYAEHISYDTSKVPVKALDADNLDELLLQIQNRKMIASPFYFTKRGDIGKTQTSFKTKVPYSMRGLLAGSNDTILDIYSIEYTFDKFNIILQDRRGQDRDFTIRYSKNMTDLEQETSSELMYNGMCPYYSSTNTETKTGLTTKYKDIYLSSDAATITPEKDPDTGENIYPSNWLSYSDAGSGISEILTTLITNIIASEGEFYNHLVHAKKVKPVGKDEEDNYFYDVTYNMAYINKDARNEFGRDWLYKDEEILTPYDPQEGQLFRIYTPGDKLYKVYIWKYDSSTTPGTYKYMEPDKDDHVETYSPIMPTTYTEQEEKDNIILYEGDIIYINEIRAIPKNGEQEYSATWLQQVEEEEQITASDSRWKVVGDITPKSGVIYKVPTIETPIQAYVREGVDYYTKDWLSLTEGGPALVPQDAKLYQVTSTDPSTAGKIFKFRWYEYDQKYVEASDTRYEYTNYEWNSVSERYIEHDSSNDKILTLDLTDKFKDTPRNNTKFQKQLYEEAIKYAKENKLGTIKDSIKVSFVKLSSSPEYSKWKDLEDVELGDTIHVVYEDLGINTLKRVSKTEFNVLTDSYDSIELGDKQSSFTNNAMIAGDDVSALTNDRNFADITTVTKLVAERIEADYIKSVTAEITEAQIQQLQADSITAALIEAERFEIDKLVAGLLIADDAAVKNTLTVGEGVVVNGEINIKKGSITISGENEIASVKAYVNPNAIYGEYGPDWLVENKDDAEYLQPQSNTIYKVYDQDDLYKGYYEYSKSEDKYISYTVDQTVYFEVDANGNLRANSAVIEGNITATSGNIGGFEITSGRMTIDLSSNLVDNSKSKFQDASQVSTTATTVASTVVTSRLTAYSTTAETEQIAADAASDALDDFMDENVVLPVSTITGLHINADNITIETTDTDPDTGEVIDTYDSLVISADGSVEMTGTIDATGGNIGGCVIIPEPKQYKEAYIIEGSTRYSADWLTLTEGSSEPISRKTPYYFRVYENSSYTFYKWSRVTHLYEDQKCGVLQVKNANISEVLTANMVNLKGLNITDNHSNTTFAIDDEGNVSLTGSITITNHNYTEKSYVDEAAGNLQDNIDYANELITNVENAIDDMPTMIFTSDAIIAKKKVNGEEVETFRLEAENGDLTINGGSIDIKFVPDDVYINPNGTTFGSNWLLKSPGGTVITPQAKEYYKVLTDGTYKNKVYIWDETQNKYIEVTSLPTSAFTVDKFGNVSANSISIISGVIDSENGTLRGIDYIDADKIDVTDLLVYDNISTPTISIGNAIINTEEVYTRQYRSNELLTYTCQIVDNVTKKQDMYYNKYKVSFTVTNIPENGVLDSDCVVNIPGAFILLKFDDDSIEYVSAENNYGVYVGDENNTKDYYFSYMDSRKLTVASFFSLFTDMHVNYYYKIITSYTLNIDAPKLNIIGGSGIDVTSITNEKITTTTIESNEIKSDNYKMKVPSSDDYYNMPYIISKKINLANWDKIDDADTSSYNWNDGRWYQIGLSAFGLSINALDKIIGVTATDYKINYGSATWNPSTYWGEVPLSNGGTRYGIFIRVTDPVNLEYVVTVFVSKDDDS